MVRLSFSSENLEVSKLFPEEQITTIRAPISKIFEVTIRYLKNSEIMTI